MAEKSKAWLKQGLFKPMKPAAGTIDWDFVRDNFKWGVIVQRKFDGIRCSVIAGTTITASGREIPNKYIREQLARLEYDADGELIVGHTFQDTTSAVMSRDGEPDFTYYVYDIIEPNEQQQNRLRTLQLYANRYPHERVQLARSLTFCNGEFAYERRNEIEGFFRENMDGYPFPEMEGLIFRSAMGLYKYGRSTEKQQYLLRMKYFLTAEAEIIGFTEAQENTNEATDSPLGYTQRSTAKEGLIGKSTLGAFIVRDLKTGVVFNLTGRLSAAQKQHIWDNPDQYLNRIVTYRYMQVGNKDKPRAPTFQHFRDERDYNGTY
jgi:DNA ligase-1